MSKKKTHEEYIEELKIKNPIIEVVEQYINIHTPIMHHCLIHDMFWKTTPGRVLQGVGCEECRKEKFRQVRCKTHEQYVEEVTAINPNIVVVGKYIDALTPVEHYCKKHNTYWSSYASNILRGAGCKECGNEKARNKNIKPHDKYVEELNIVNPNIEVIEEYQGAGVAILHRCKIDGYVWPARPANLLFGKGCPQCNESHGEKQIRQWLSNYKIEYVPQKTFNDCRNKRPLPFDFYLPLYNTCIEYDGEQHFMPIDHFGGEERFKQCQYNDKIKNQYCKDNNICLLRIPYYKNIEEELNNFYSFNIVTHGYTIFSSL